MKHLRIAVFVTLVVTALLVLQGTTIAPALFSTTQQQRAVEVDLRRQLQVANRELASVQERLELASAQGQRLQERLDSLRCRVKLVFIEVIVTDPEVIRSFLLQGHQNSISTEEVAPGDVLVLVS